MPAGNTEASAISHAARPVLTTTDAFALHLNGDRLDAVHVADAHTAADIVVRWNDADVVALGDIYWSGQYPLHRRRVAAARWRAWWRPSKARSPVRMRARS